MSFSSKNPPLPTIEVNPGILEIIAESLKIEASIEGDLEVLDLPEFSKSDSEKLRPANVRRVIRIKRLEMDEIMSLMT